MLARDVTSTPSNPSASSARTSASCRACRGSAPMVGREITDQPLESQPIAVRAEPGHHPDRRVREQRAASLRLAREDVRQVHLHEREAHGEQRVPHRETRVRERRRVDERAVGVTAQPLDRVRSEEHTSELQSLAYLVCRLLLEKKKTYIACQPHMQAYSRSTARVRRT